MLKLTYEVPQSVQRVAQRALVVHKGHPLSDVIGVGIAEALASGRVGVDQVGRMHRFFLVNQNQYQAEAQLFHTEHDSPLVRSYHLFGAEAGRRWSEKLVGDAIKEGYLPADGLSSLLTQEPDDVYAAFQLGAWRYEYDLNPKKAARFVEEYFRSTGWDLDLKRAFGDGARAVGTALTRRIQGPDPFKEVAKAIATRDAEYRLSAEVDLSEMGFAVDEGLQQATWKTLSPIQAAKVVWPQFIAYAILAVEAPNLLVEVNNSSQKPPKLNQKPAPYTAYHDAINTYVTYFHPDGSRYVDPSGVKNFESLSDDIETFMWRAYYGKKMTPIFVQKLLGRARRWTAQNKLAGSLFHVYNADWKKANWQHILDAIPIDADIRSAFEEFVGKNPLPAAGIKLQQTLSHKATKQIVRDFLIDEEAMASIDSLKPVKVNSTFAGKAADTNGTPMGVYSVLRFAGTGQQLSHLGAYSTKKAGVVHVLAYNKGNDLALYADAELRDALDGKIEVVQAHKDMSGTVYGAKVQPKPPKSTSAQDEDPANTTGLPDDFVEWILDNPDRVDMQSIELSAIQSLPVSSTAFGDAATNKGFGIQTGTSWKFYPLGKPNPHEWELVSGARIHGSHYVVFRAKSMRESLVLEEDPFAVLSSMGAANLVQNNRLIPDKKAKTDLPEPAAQTATQEVPSPLASLYAGTFTQLKELMGKTEYFLSDWEVIDPSESKAAEALWSKHEEALAVGEAWAYGEFQRIYVACLRAKDDSNDIIHLFRASGQQPMVLTDATLTSMIKDGTTLPEYLAKFDPPPAVGTADPTTTPPDDPAAGIGDPFEFTKGDVIQYLGGPHLVTYVGKDASPPTYHLLELSLDNAAAKTMSPMLTLKEAVDSGASLIEGSTFDVQQLGKHLTLPDAFEPTDEADWPDGLKYGDELMSSYGKTVILLFLGKFGDQSAVIGASFNTHSFDYEYPVFAMADAPPIVTSSYDPGFEDVLAPESHLGEDENLDPETGNFEKSGVQQAFDWLAKKGWTPAVASESPSDFQFGLGERRGYKSGAFREIVGYGYTDKGVPVYVIVTEKSNVNWVTTTNAHKKYGMVLSLEQSILDNLLPKPGAEAQQKYPKLKYVLSDWAKEWYDKAEGHEFVNSPVIKGLPFVGSPLELGTLQAWVELPTGKILGLIGKAGGSWEVHEPETIASWGIKYPEDDSIKYHEEDADFELAKGSTSTLSFNSNVIPFTMPSDDLTPGWDTPQPIAQPPFQALPKGKRVSAGLVALLPSGTYTKVGPYQGASNYPRVMMIRPLGGEFKGYKLAFPKGSIGKGESLLKGAVREAWEETGCTVKPVAFLGDYRGNESITRLYVGYVTGGNPRKKTKPDESESINLYTLDPGLVDRKWYKDLVSASGKTWQQQAILDALDWVEKNGEPHLFEADTTTEDATPTLEADVDNLVTSIDVSAAFQSSPPPKSGLIPEESEAPKPTPTVPGNWKPNIPASKVYEEDVWKVLYFKSPFPITQSMVGALKLEVKQGVSAPVSFDVARVRSEGPAFGEFFETEAGTPYASGGYVSWLGEDGNAYHYLLGLTTGGSVDVLPCESNGLPNAHILKDQSLSNTSGDPFYVHPDQPAATEALMKQVWETGSLKGTGFTMASFKKHCAAANVPAWAVITSNIVQDVASMFVSDACSQAQHDMIVACLKARMKQTHSGKSKKGKAAVKKDSPTTAAPPTPAPSYSPPSAPTKTTVPIGVLSPVHKNYTNNPQPHLFSSASGQTLTSSSKPSAILKGPGQTKWFAKWDNEGGFRPYVDQSAFQFSELCKKNNVPVGVMEYEGKTVSYQPFAENASPPPSDPSNLTDENKAELLAQHAVDMFMGDHDGNATNWISVDGKLVAVDRGQAWKFILQGKKESLDPSWHAPGNFGKGYAKGLLLQWRGKQAEIPQMAFAAMRQAILRIASVSDQQLTTILTPVMDALDLPAAKRKSILTKLKKRRDSYEKDWAKVLKDLRSDFKWPAVATPPKPKVFKSSPQSMGFTARETSDINDAINAKALGKSLRIDGPAIEQQQVMCKRVLMDSNGSEVPATLVHFRVTRRAGLDAVQKLAKNVHVEHHDDVGGPHRLKADKQNQFWERIHASIKSVNHHLSFKKDTDINMSTVAAMQALKPTLEQIIEASKDPTGSYQGEPNEAVFAMAEQYLQYINIVDYWVENKSELVGQHSPTFAEFLWEDPPEDVPEEKPNAPAYKLYAKSQGAVWPSTTAHTDGSVKVTNLSKAQYNSSLQSQYVIDDATTGAKVFWNPPGKAGVSGLKEGVESQKGQGWAIMPGDPTPETVAHLLTLFQDATGLDMSAATPEDEEAMYWSQQAAILQSDGKPKPEADHTVVKEAGYKKALDKLHAGDTTGAITDLKAMVRKKTGMTASQLKAAADIAVHHPRGVGFGRQERIGWTREKLQEVMGANCHIAHRLAGDVPGTFNELRKNGALLANAIKAFYGVTKTGASPGSDMQRGGGQGLFACFRKGFTSTKGMIYFDIALALRLDVYIVGTGDTFGDTSATRYYTPETWVGMNAHMKTGATSASSSQQVNIRHDIDIQEYLVRVVCGSKAVADQCIQIAKEEGWTFRYGGPPEKVFVAK